MHPLEACLQLSSVICPCGSGAKTALFWWQQYLGFAQGAAPWSSLVLLLGLSNLTREMFLGGSGESSPLALFEAVMWAQALQQTLAR